MVAVENRFEMKLENPLSVVGSAEVSRGFEYASETSVRLLNGSRKDESINFCLKILARYISNAPRIDCHDYSKQVCRVKQAAIHEADAGICRRRCIILNGDVIQCVANVAGLEKSGFTRPVKSEKGVSGNQIINDLIQVVIAQLLERSFRFYEL